MSCDVALAAFIMLASTGSGPSQPLAAAAAPVSVAGEPLFVDIVGRANALKAAVEAYRTGAGLSASPTPITLSNFDGFKAKVSELAALDEKGHVELTARGTADDLKCILHGISQDLPVRVAALESAKTGKEEDQALRDMSYLLNDNVEVITAPPKPAA